MKFYTCHNKGCPDYNVLVDGNCSNYAMSEINECSDWQKPNARPPRKISDCDRCRRNLPFDHIPCDKCTRNPRLKDHFEEKEKFLVVTMPISNELGVQIFQGEDVYCKGHYIATGAHDDVLKSNGITYEVVEK